MSSTTAADTLTRIEKINFLVTNRLPRQLATRIMGFISNVQSPLLTRLAIGVWNRFDPIDFSEAKESSFNSIHECFTRQLKDDARPVDPDPKMVTSPCDAIIGEFGKVESGQLFQAKGFPYALSELIPNPRIAEKYRDGLYITLRLKSSFYHRFHAPVNCQVKQITYISGDTWNVNPVALKVIERLFCKNERALVDLRLANSEEHIALVPVAAILVASMKLHCIPETLDMHYDGPEELACNSSYQRGDEMGYFQHGSTIILFSNNHFKFRKGLAAGQRVNMGEALLKRVN